MTTKASENRGETGEAARRMCHVAPVTHIRRLEDGTYVLEAEMPGVAKDGVEVSVENGELTLLGRKSLPRESGTPLVREIRDADYRRVFELDPEIDTGRILARMEQGILRVTLPLAERVKPRTIQVG